MKRTKILIALAMTASLAACGPGDSNGGGLPGGGGGNPVPSEPAADNCPPVAVQLEKLGRLWCRSN